LSLLRVASDSLDMGVLSLIVIPGRRSRTRNLEVPGSLRAPERG
jgi:hypothetical protein